MYPGRESAVAFAGNLRSRAMVPFRGSNRPAPAHVAEPAHRADSGPGSVPVYGSAIRRKRFRAWPDSRPETETGPCGVTEVGVPGTLPRCTSGYKFSVL